MRTSKKKAKVVDIPEVPELAGGFVDAFAKLPPDRQKYWAQQLTAPAQGKKNPAPRSGERGAG